MDIDSFKKTRNIIIGLIYRPQNTVLKLFNGDINELLDTLLGRKHKYCYLIGDYNVNLLNYSKHAETTSLIGILCSIPFCPTRLFKGSATLIDNMFTNCHPNIDNILQNLIYTDVSDHFSMVHVDYSMKLFDTESVMTRRNISYKNWD